MKRRKQIRYVTVKDLGSYGGTLRFENKDEAKRYLNNLYKRFGRDQIGMNFKLKGRYLKWE